MENTTVHIVQRMAPGGIETLVLDLARGDSRSNTSIFSLEGDTPSLVGNWQSLTSVAGQLHAFDAGPGFKPGLIVAIACKLRALRPRAVFLHHIGPLIYGGLAARAAGVPRIVHVEHDVWHYKQQRRRTITAIAERIVRPHHVAVSDNAAQTLRLMMKGATVSVIHNGIDLERFQPGDMQAARRRFGLDPNCRIVGTAGRLVAVKGHDVLLRAIAMLPVDCHCAIAGSGEERDRLVHLADSLNISDRVHLLGHVDRVETVLPAFDVFCLPSHAEGFPRSAIEAQAADIPVVATNVGAMMEAVCPTSGRIAPPGNPAALAAAINETLAVKAASPREYVAARFSWQRTLQAYREVMEVPRAA